MKNSDKKVKPGWEIPRVIKEKFRDFCAEMGTTVQEDCAGALFIWQYLPAQIREWAKLEAKSNATKPQDFWRGFRDGVNSQIPRLLENLSHKKKAGRS